MGCQQQKILSVANRLRKNRDGTHMQFQQKNKICRYHTQILLLPITGALFLKKPIPPESSKENTLDFHLTIIKKIDALLDEHEKETSANDPAPVEAASSVPRQPPVELRPQLGRRMDHVEIDLPHILEPSIIKNRVIPQEFKTDLSFGIEPEFKFITSLDSIENALNIKPRHHNRVEIIDLGDFTTDDVSSHLSTPPTIDIQNILRTSFIKKQNERKEPPHTKKMEIIDARTLTQQTFKDVFLTAQKQNEEIEKKAQIYYLNSKDHSDAKNKKIEFRQSYIPDDFEEIAKKLKEKQEQEENERQKQEEKQQKQLEREHEKQSKLEAKKSKVEEKKQPKEKEQKKEPPQPTAEQPTKKQLKEQKRLQKIEARKAKIEERKKMKKEKQALREQQKQQRLSQRKQDKKQKPTKEKKVEQSTELDEEIKKVLLMTDALLGELPENVINRFVQSDDFELYERVLNKYRIK